VTINNGGFTLRNTPDFTALIQGGSTGAFGKVLEVHGDNITFYGLEVNGGGTRNCFLLGNGGESSPTAWANDLTFDHVRIHECGDTDHEHGIYAEFTKRLHVVDSLIYHNGGYGIQMYPQAEDSLIEYDVLDGSGAVGNAWNLVFAGESAGGEYSQPHCSHGNIVKYSLITFPRGTHGNVASYYPNGSCAPFGNEVSFSCVFTTVGVNFGQYDGPLGYSQHDNTIADPGYTNRATGDFRHTGPACLDKGPR
jgi:hypothetical protein